MTKLITNCPACQGIMKISSLQCPDCGMELRNSFEFSLFDNLSDTQHSFLLSFLKNRGNLKDLQAELQISYPTAKRRLDELLNALLLDEAHNSEHNFMEETNMASWSTDTSSPKASEIIKTKLKANRGRVIVHTLQGLPCEIRANADGKTFWSNKLPIKPPYEYEVFDIIVDLLLENHCRAKKGNGRNYKLGQPGCELDTVVGAVSARYSKKDVGESVFDPVFVLAAVMDWAGIAHNERGELILTQEYRNLL